MKPGPLLNPTAARTDWETPQPLFDEYDREFAFTLDVCATADNAKCRKYITPEGDGLTWPWSPNVCWMNPPYGPAIKAWMQKAYAESQRGATVVCLVPARTDTAWWHEYAEKGERRFIQGRVNHLRSDGQRSRSTFPSAIVIFRPQRCSDPEAA